MPVLQLRPGVDIESCCGPPMEYETFDFDSYKAQLSSLEIPPFPAFRQYVAGQANINSSPWATVISVGTPMAAPPPSLAGTLAAAAPASVSATMYTAPVSDSLLRTGRSLVPDLGSPTSESSRGADADTPTDPFIMTSNVSRMVSADNESMQYYGRTATTGLARAAGDEAALLKELDRVKSKRSKVWKTPEWEVCVNNTGQRLIDWTIWPEDDLAMTLIDAYFDWVNSVKPLLHRPLFRQQYFARLYMSDYDFAKVCLMVFANGARHVFAPLAQWRRAQDVGHLTSSERPNDGCVFSDGWKFARGLMSAGDSLHKAPTLFRLQTAALLAQFLHGNTDATVPWAIAGSALRAAQEIGLHVDGPGSMNGASGAERQLLLRAFWCLYHYDRGACVALGRSVALHDSDIETAYPLAVDDENWDADGDEDVPIQAGSSKVAAFVHVIQLDRIVSAAVSTLPARRDAGFGLAARLPAILIELAAALNKWATALPASLRWDPESRDTAHLTRTAILHARFHWVRIFVHYAPAAVASSVGGVGVGAPPQAMLDIALESARAVFGVCAALLAHEAFTPAAQRPLPLEFIDYAWVSGAVALVAIRTGAVPPGEVEDVMAGVATSVRTLQQMECVSRKSGQVADVLTAMARVTRPPAPAHASRIEYANANAQQQQQHQQQHPQHQQQPPQQPQQQPQHHISQLMGGGHPQHAHAPATPDLSWLGDPSSLFMPPIFDGATPGSDAMYTDGAGPAAGAGAGAGGPGNGGGHGHGQSSAPGNSNGNGNGNGNGTGPGAGRRTGDEMWAHLLETFV